ncbi:MAG TPA: efflux RND transporter permease subunit [Candidatus Ozemobacteraceae bacterium]|nr:efflux RND transporter permease subunit [Candidatus Ozemobacteraceae bacterium]
MRYIRWCINNPVSVNLLVLFLIISGGISLYSMKREIFPSFSLDRVLITVVFPGASPEEVEEGVCIKIEEALTGLAGIKKVSATARESTGIVIAEIETGEDIDELKNEIETRINSINTFPRDAEKPVIKKLELIRQTLQLVVSGALTDEAMRELAEEIRRDLLALPEISQIMLDGLKDHEVSIEVSEATLREFGLSFDDVARAIRTNSLDLSGGVVRTPGGEVLLRVKGQKYIRREFEDLVIRTASSGATIRLSQIAHVRDGFADGQIEASLNGEKACMVSVFKTEEEDALVIADTVREYAERKRLELPPAVKLTILNDTSVAVRSRLDLLSSNGLQGLILVFVCLWLFMDLKLSLWVSFGIPVSMLGSFLLLGIMDQTLNMMSMFGLIMALGMIVDDAIVISESTYSQLEKNPFQNPARAALYGTARVFWPVLASVTTTIVAFLPLLAITGIMGKFIAVLPITVISCLLMSLVEALTSLPCHLAHSLTAPKPEQPHSRLRDLVDRGFRRIIAVYARLLRVACAFRYATVGLAIFILLTSIGIVRAGWVPFVLFARNDSDTVIARVVFPEGTSFEATRGAIIRLKAAISQTNQWLKTTYQLKTDAVRHSFALIGQHSGNEPTFGTNRGELLVELLPAEERTFNSGVVLQKWQEFTGPMPEARSLVFVERETGPGGRPIEVQLRSTSFDKLRSASKEMREHLTTFPGVYNIEDDFKEGATELRFDLKDGARHLGLSLADLAGQLRHGFYGNEALRLQRGRFDVKVFVRYPEQDRRYLSTLLSMTIRGPNGAEIPLSDVANIREHAGTAEIKRVEGQRVISVLADVDERKANAAAITTNLVSSGYLDLLCRKHGISYAFEGQRKETMESLAGLRVGFALSFLGIYIILATIFASYLQPIIIMVAIPFGIIGALIGHWIMGYPLTMMSMFGLVALSGIVVNNSLLIVDYINEAVGQGTPLADALILAGSERFRPIMSTSLTTFFGVSSLLFERSFQAQFLIPMAITLAWGLIFSTLLSLILIPALYAILVDGLRLMSRLRYGQWPSDAELLLTPEALPVEPGES